VLLQLILQLLDFPSLARISRSSRSLGVHALHKESGKCIDRPPLGSSSPLRAASLLNATTVDHHPAHRSPIFRAPMPMSLQLLPPLSDHSLVDEFALRQRLLEKARTFRRLHTLVVLATSVPLSLTASGAFSFIAQPWMQRQVDGGSVVAKNVWFRDVDVQVAAFSLPHLTHLSFLFPQPPNSLFASSESEERIDPTALAHATNVTQVTIMIAHDKMMQQLSPLSVLPRLTRLDLEGDSDSGQWAGTTTVLAHRLSSIQRFHFSSFSFEDRSQREEFAGFLSHMRSLDTLELEYVRSEIIVRAVMSAGVSALPSLRHVICGVETSVEDLPVGVVRRLLRRFPLVDLTIRLTNDHDHTMIHADIVTRLLIQFGAWSRVHIPLDKLQWRPPIELSRCLQEDGGGGEIDDNSAEGLQGTTGTMVPPAFDGSGSGAFRNHAPDGS